jgi:DNA-binding response OmpR family regulator
VLDVGLPGLDGLAVCRRVRERGLALPILLLTARDAVGDRVTGLDVGADDYLAKPFDLSILLARIKSLLRRTSWQRERPAAAAEPEPNAEYAFNHRTIRFDHLELIAPNRTTHLTVMEADLLRYLTDREGQIVSRKEILEQVWRVHEDTDTRAIDNFIVRLRRYIEDDPANPQHLITVRGIGYRFVAKP